VLSRLTAARPWLAPRWNPASRSLVAAADLEGAGASDGGRPIVPGTRLARGTRTGRPAVVMPLEDGVRTVRAASQPWSDDPQPPPAAAAPPDAASPDAATSPDAASPDRVRRFPNQSDSTAS
jgi:hypothetical protein